MSTIFIVNISIEIFSSILCFVFIICIFIADNPNTPLNKAFIKVLLCNIGVMLSDALAFLSIRKTSNFFKVTNYIGNYCTYLFSYLLLLSFCIYIVTYFSSKNNISKTALYLNYIVLGSAIVLSIVSLFNDMYFMIDENNIYHRQEMYWLSQVLGIISLLINMSIIIKYRKTLNRSESFAMASYIVLPVIAVIIQMLFYGFVSVYISSTLVIMIMYVGLQVEQARLLEMELAEGRVAIMLSQIQPHFLYNTLNAISKLCYDNPEANRALLTFSTYLRGNMDALAENKLISFEKELEHVQQYLWLEILRFEEKLKVFYEIQTTGFMLPALTLQPLVENAVRYGVSKKRSGGTVIIHTEEMEDNFRITVTDDGIGFDTEKPPKDGRSHTGIPNVRGRLSAMCSGTLTIESTIGKGTIAVIEIPKGGIKR